MDRKIRWGAIMALVAALLGAAATFVLELSEEQISALLLVVGAVGPLVGYATYPAYKDVDPRRRTKT